MLLKAERRRREDLQIVRVLVRWAERGAFTAQELIDSEDVEVLAALDHAMPEITVQGVGCLLRRLSRYADLGVEVHVANRKGKRVWYFR